MSSSRDCPVPETDAALVDSLNSGDPRAFERLYLRHREWVWRVAVRYLGDESESWDVTQTVFMDFLKRFPGFVLTSRLTTYFYPVTRNFAFAVARKRKRTNLVAMDGDTSLPALALPTNESDESERHRHLRNALARLPATHAEVLLMAVVDELTMEEIGVALGIPTGTVKSRLYHALGKLRKDEQCVRYFETIEVNG